MPPFTGKQFMICPKYLGYIISLSIFINYILNPKWNDWKWKLLMFFIFVNIGSICYNRYQDGLSFGIITDIIWLLFYITILRFYGPKFDKPDDVKKQVNNDKLKIGPKLKWIAGIGIALSIVIVVLCVCQFIPVVNTVAIPVMRVLSFVL